MKFLTLFFAVLLAGCAGTPTRLPVVEKSPEPVSEAEVQPKKKRPDPVLKADYVLTVLGQPTLKRKEYPAQVWVYAQSSCVLFVYLDDEAGRVKHMEIGTPSQTREKDSLSCLKTAAKLM